MVSFFSFVKFLLICLRPLQDRLDTEVRKKQELESKLKTKGHELEESQKRLDKLEEHIRVSKIQLDEQEKMASDLQGNVGCSKEKIADLQRELVRAVFSISFRLFLKKWLKTLIIEES